MVAFKEVDEGAQLAAASAPVQLSREAEKDQHRPVEPYHVRIGEVLS